jgi:hypothetical protein
MRMQLFLWRADVFSDSFVALLRYLVEFHYDYYFLKKIAFDSILVIVRPEKRPAEVVRKLSEADPTMVAMVIIFIMSVIAVCSWASSEQDCVAVGFSLAS